LFEREDANPPATIHQALRPLIEGYGDVQLPELYQPTPARHSQPELPIKELVSPELYRAGETLWLIPGDLLLSTFEDQLSETWPKCSNGDIRAFRVTSAFWRVVQMGAKKVSADLILVDVGPNLGPLIGPR
jgi:chromosome partitioning protein